MGVRAARQPVPTVDDLARPSGLLLEHAEATELIDEARHRRGRDAAVAAERVDVSGAVEQVEQRVAPGWRSLHHHQLDLRARARHPPCGQGNDLTPGAQAGSLSRRCSCHGWLMYRSSFVVKTPTRE